MLDTDLIKSKMARLDAKIEFVSELSGISCSALSLALRGTKALSHDRYRALNATLDDMADLVAFHGGVPIQWKNTELIRDRIYEMKRDKRRQEQAAAAGINPLELLAELAASDIEAVCAKRSWTKQQLVEQIATARMRLQETRSALSQQ